MDIFTITITVTRTKRRGTGNYDLVFHAVAEDEDGNVVAEGSSVDLANALMDLSDALRERGG